MQLTYNFQVRKMFSIWWLRCISNLEFRMVQTSIIFRNTIRELWLHFFLNTKIFNSNVIPPYNHFHYYSSGFLIHTKAHHNVYRSLQPMDSNRKQLLQWLASNFISKKFFEFEFLNPEKQDLETLPLPPPPQLNTLSSTFWFHLNQIVWPQYYTTYHTTYYTT